MRAQILEDFWDAPVAGMGFRSSHASVVESRSTATALPRRAEANLDVAAKQGTIGVVVPLLRQACGSDDPASVEPPVYVGGEVKGGRGRWCFLG